MMKYVIYFVIAAIAAGLLAGGVHLARVKIKNKKEMSAYSGAKTEVSKTHGKALVIYYSMSGNTREIARKIQAKTNADIFEIKTAEPLEPGAGLYMDIRSQLKTGEFPKLESLPDVENYDVVFVGGPVWWYTAATPVLSLLENMDFKGKKVAPFSTQGSNYGKFFEDFAAKAKNAKLLKGAGFNNLSGKYEEEVGNKISVWLNGLE